MKNSTSGGWRVLSLDEALPSLEEGVLSQLSVEDFACVLHECRKERDQVHALRLHAYMCKSGLEAHTSLGNYLISLLVEVGSLRNAQQVFDRLAHRNKWSWNSLITGYIKCGKPQHALTLYQKMPKGDPVHLSGHTFVALLKTCVKLKDLERGLEIHAEVAKMGLLKRDLFVGNTLIDMYAKYGLLAKAQQVFDMLPVRDVVSWTTLIAGYAEHGHGEEALKCFEQMQLDGVFPNAVTFIYGLKACGSIGATRKGREIHAEIERQGLLEVDLFVGSTLVYMYAKCGSLAIAQEVFDNLPVRDIVLWTTLIAGYTDHGCGEEALKCFEQMQLEGITPNSVTFVCSLKACGSIGAADKGREIHAEIERKGLLERDLVIGNTLVNMYVKFGLVAIAQEVFDKIPVRDVVSWTALIAGYAEHGYGKEALELFEQMQLQGVPPNAVTLVCSLKACGCIGASDKGLEIHAEIERQGLLKRDLVVGNSLVDMYAKCGSLVKAQQVFDRLPKRNIVSWNALIAGYADYGHSQEALKCFERMQCEGVSPDAVTFVCSLKACGSIGARDKGGEIHAEIERQGLLERDLVVGNTLVDMYTKCGLLAIAHQVFDKLAVRNIVSWNVLMAGYAEHGHGEEALKCFEQMQLKCVSPNAVTFICILKACGSIGAKDKGQEIHAEIERRGFLEGDLIVGNSLVNMYVKCGLLAKAQKIFDKLPVRNVVTWNTLIAGYIEHGHGKEALKYYEQMQLQGVLPDAVSFVCSLKACGITGDTEKGQEIHAEIERNGLLERDLVVGNTLVDMYAKCGLLALAQQVFDKLRAQDLVSWAALIAGYAEHGHGEKALECFKQMQLQGFSPNAVTFVCSLKACGSIRATDKGQKIHAEIEKRGLLERSPILGNTLVDMYVKCGLLAKAQQVLDRLPVRNAVSWNVLIAGYAAHGHGEEALKCFERMKLEGVSPETVTLVCSLKACGNIGAIDKGQEIHAQIERQGLLERDIFVGSSLVDMYAKCGSLARAQQVFAKLPVRNIVLWNALMDAYAKHGHNEEALKCFEQMQLEGVSPDAVMFVCSLNACGSIGATDKGGEIHAEIERRGLLERDLVGNSLVNMYAKCGSLAKAQRVFDKLSVRDVVSWTALMAGYARLGETENAFLIFDRMIGEGLKPDSVTFVVVLNACSRTGLFNKSQTYFEAMDKDYGTVPTLEHHTCMVDLLGRIGQLDGAAAMIKKMPFSPNLVVWYTVLGSCRNWGNVEFGKQAFKHAVCLDEKDAVAYVFMSHIYAGVDWKGEANKVEAMGA